MAVSADVTISQDGGHVKLHPYLVALVRWCVSCLWSTATVVLHRLMTAPLPPIAGSKASKSRPAGKDHLHPEPRVECVVLHHPQVHNLDVIFVHGLYGSLGNTWRQGEWRSRYENDPERIHLRRPTSIPIPNNCYKCIDTNINKDDCGDENDSFDDDNDFSNEENMNNDNAFTNIDEKFYNNINKILPKDDVFITEKFYNNTLLNQVEIAGNYETQAKFVSDLFKNNCDNECDAINENNEENLFNNEPNVFNNDQNIFDNAENIYNNEQNVKNNVENVCKCNKRDKNEVQMNEGGCKCKVNEGKQCEVGCGCICDECYSPCWPKDWIQVDYPDARVISINYTSDPHLWRPLWIKENKRLRLHERAEQMTQQLLDLGVGKRPVIWVGHSKGGLFIKQMYCEAYDAYLKIKHQERLKEQSCDAQSMSEFNNDNEINNCNDNINNKTIDAPTIIENMINNEENRNNDNDTNNIYNNEPTTNVEENTINNKHNEENNNDNEEINVRTKNKKEISTDLRVEYQALSGKQNAEVLSSNTDEDKYDLHSRAGLWSHSVGFMFYSVPHRGSPLADIKAPLTARSVELLEITKDCSLVLTLQDRWLRAASPAQPLVRSLVETKRTLMSVLWLRIVSADSADPGLGALCGVSVDHREICKPSSRRCQLYTELTSLINAALNTCNCN